MNQHSSHRKLITDGLLVGLVAGFFTLFYRFLLMKLDLLRSVLYDLSSYQAALWILAALLLGLLMGKLLQIEPLSSGSGIPQVQAEILGELEMEPKRVLLTKILGGGIANLIGLSLGREGPSIQIGASAAKGLSKVLKRNPKEEKALISAGASAGLAAAFNAPLAGTLFTLEEMHKNFSTNLLIPSLVASVTADFFAKYVFGLQPIFSFTLKTYLPLSSYGYVLLLGLGCGILGVLFNRGTLLFQDFFEKTRLPKQYRPLIAVILCLLVGFSFPSFLGGGHHLVEELPELEHHLSMLLFLLIGKMVFTWICYGSGAQGGLFLPMLVLGALFGCVIFHLGFLGQVPDIYLRNFMVLGMAGMLTAVVRSPILSIILVTEMTGNLYHLLSLSMVSITAYLVAEILKNPPLYHSLLERLLGGKKIDTLEN